jgi:hypothetical protein
MQTVLVIVIFTLAVGYLLKKFLWVPIFESRQRTANTLDGNRTKCGNKDCGCH